ncbi:MAG: GtrA family protein [Erysipelotrichaceae bacterium]|nr:GtrA family protein [Erysipelotrichaceae bacterium]
MNKKGQLLQVIKYSLIAASAGLIQVGSFTLFEEVLHWAYWPSYLTALLLSVLWNFTFNRKYTFKSTSNVPKAMALVLAYYAVFTPLSTWWGNELTKIGWNDYLVLGFTMIINFITEFLFQKFVVFSDTKDKV